MALTRHTRTKVGIREIPINGQGQLIKMGLPYPATFTNYNVTQRWVGSSREASYPGSAAIFTFYYGYVNWNATVSGGGITASTAGQMKSDRKNTQSDAQYWANINNPSGIAFAVGSTYQISGGSTPQGKVETYEEEYYTGKLTVKKVLDNGTEQTVSEVDYDAGVDVTIPIPVAFSNSVLSGVTIDGGTQSTYKKDGYTVTMNDNHVVVFRFTSTVSISVAVGTGGKTITGSSKTSFTNVSTSATATATSGKKSFTVQKGQSISISAEAAANYVLHTNAVTSSASSSYGTISGNGGTSVSSSKTCTGENTFTVNGTQYSVTPSIVDGGVGKSSWGTAKIKEHSSSTWSTGAIVLKPNTTYDLGFDSKTASTYAPTVDHWSIGGVNYTGSFSTGATITGNLAAYLYINQTKWQLTVANGTNSAWGTVSGGGWYASGVRVPITFTPSAAYQNIAVQSDSVNYNNETIRNFRSGDTILTTNAALTATMYLKQTKFKMSLAYGVSGTNGWGTISADKEYVGTGDVVKLTFNPTESLVNTIHPQVDHWTFLQQTSTPTPAADGSSSVNVTLETVSSAFTAYAHLASSWRKVTVRRSDSLPAAWGDFDLVGEGFAVKERYFAPGSKIKIKCTASSSLELKERPQVNYLTVGIESTINGVDGTFEYEYTLPANVKTDLVIDCYVKQTAWPVTVNTDGNGSLTAKRMSISAGMVMASVTSSGTAQTIYLRSGNAAEYLALTTTAKEHYDFSAWSKTNLSNYGGDVKKVQLSTAAAASVSATFARGDFKITCMSDDTSRADAYLQNDAQTVGYFDKKITQNPVVICKLKATYAKDYKVASWSIGSQDDIAPQYNAQGDFYYVEVTNRNDVTVTAHIVRTSFKLTINVGPNNYAQFGTIIATAGEQSKQFNNSDTTYSFTVKEESDVNVVFYQKYGGRVLQIHPSSAIASPAITDKAISFKMPSSDCSVSFSFGEKEKYPLTVGVQNTSLGEESNIPSVLTVKSRTYSGIVIGETEADGLAKTFNVYKDEEYSIVAKSIDEYLSRRYTMLGWKDGHSFIPGADTDTINVLNASTSPLTRTIVYGLRETGTVTVEYAKKQGGIITTLPACPEGCSFKIENTRDKIGEDHWLVGADIKMPYTVMGVGFDRDGDAYKWTPIEVDVALATEEYSANETWDDGLLTQDGVFMMRGNMKVRVIFVETHVPGYTSMSVGFKLNTTKLMGSVSMFATDMDAYTDDSIGARALVRKEKKAVIMAAPRPGFAFSGWWTLSEGVYTIVPGAKAVFEVPFVTSPATTYYAEFVASTNSNVKQWNADATAAKMFEWQSKVYVGAQFFKMQSVRVYSDGYPVTLTIFASSSPDDIFGPSTRSVSVVLGNQNPRRLPKVRPEKYFAFKVSGYSRINHIGIASSMKGLTA